MGKDTLRHETQRLLHEGNQALSDAKSYLLSRGQVVELDKWLTIKAYCRQFGIKNEETVMNWIRRGKVPADCVKVIEELNGIRLIKAIPYQTKVEKPV